MDANNLICIKLDAAPEMIEPWLQTLAQGWTLTLPKQYVVGPTTRTPGGPTPHETLAIYAVEATPTGVGQVALAVTYVPLRSSRACLELRGGPFLPATLDTVVQQCATVFAMQYPVVSSVAVPLEEVGARPLACNRWLDNHMVRMGEATFAEFSAALYRPWLEQYRALRGDEPADPRRSFRAAVNTARRRLRHAALSTRAE